MVNGTNRPIVVGVDGSTSAAQAARWAAREAARRSAPLVIVHASAPVPVAVPHAMALGPYRHALEEQGRQWLAEATAAVKETAPDVMVSTELSIGGAAEQLIGRSASAELVALGSRGLGGFTGLMVGSIAAAVATHGHCPVVVVRGADAQTEPRQDGPVVVGMDGSPASQAAVPFAFEAASSRDAPLVAVHAWSDLPIATVWDLAADWGAIEQQETKLLAQWLAEYQTQYPDVPVEQVVARDRPAHILLDHAKSAQLVVVGSRGRGGFRGLLLGSTGQALIYHAACPVAVVPPRSPVAG
ncbi:universal stress protein [Amycolatopsis sp. lyj-108]|uniref:universal stress protein n=1 Tax=Amycolatopsis sp. lyj-108 TaxID=2789286 RepID=UPI00397C5C53